MTIFKPKDVDFRAGYDAASTTMQDNFATLKRIDAEAKAAGELLHRYVSHPIADGRAYYQIVKVNAKTVRIRVVTGIGDDWTIPAWGNEATISRATAAKLIAQRDGMARLFGRA